MGERLAAGEQALLFLNRRGYAPLTICRACGHQVGCDACDARMVEHRFRKRLVCHQCGATKPIPTACPACKVEGKMTTLGPGVERLAEEAAALWPEARLAILSSDLAEGPRALKARIDEIARGGADLVIGTQLVSKGHNFPHLTLVGVIDADLGLQGGDLRAAEKTFQLIRQVAGRAGRAERPGLALVQTHQPEHPALRAILSGDDEGFWRAEAEARRRALMPPYGRLAGVIVTGTDEARTWEVARALARAGEPLRAAGAELWGPAPAPIARIRGRHRVRMLVRAPKGVALQPALRAWAAAVPCPSTVRVTHRHGSAELLLRAVSLAKYSAGGGVRLLRPAPAVSPPPVITCTRWPMAKAGSPWTTAMEPPFSSRTVHSIDCRPATALPACRPAAAPAVAPTPVAITLPVPPPTSWPSAAPARPPRTAPAAWLPWPPCSWTARLEVTVPNDTVEAVRAWFAGSTLPFCCGVQAASAAARVSGGGASQGGCQHWDDPLRCQIVVRPDRQRLS